MQFGFIFSGKTYKIPIFGIYCTITNEINTFQVLRATVEVIHTKKGAEDKKMGP